MYRPKVSIVIPVYNGSNYIEESILSAINQTYKNIEIIVINDGSNDNGKTENIINKYHEKIRYFYKENGGVSSALNYGIQNMKGEWFSWLSHDDLYYPNKIEEQIAYLNNNSKISDYDEIYTNLVYCDTEFINDKGKVILKLNPIAKENEENLEILLKNLKKNRLGGCSFLVHKKALNLVGGFNENIRTVSDYDLWYRFLLANYKFLYVPKTLVQGRMHKSQVTYTLSKLGYKEFEEFHIWLIKSLEGRLQDPMYFYKIGVYARQRGYIESSDHAFEIVRKQTSLLKYMYLINTGKIYSNVYRVSNSFMKKIYTKLFIK